MPDQYTRQPAVKIDIASLRGGTFKENNDWQPNYISTVFGDIYRVNIIGIVIAKNIENSSILVDDGTATINVTFSFSDTYEIEKCNDIQEGQGILLVGRPRKYGEDMYIAPEVIHLLKDLTWLKVRKAELHQQHVEGFYMRQTQTEEKEKMQQRQSISTDNTENDTISKQMQQDSTEQEEIKDSYDIIYSVLKDHDKGNGVNIDFLISLLEEKNIKPGKTFITKLLEQGDIFEIMPGMIKLLE